MYVNRELSWLAFNERVLHQAARTRLPLLERLKFLSISASNLDEFFQVRVGSLMMMKRAGNESRDISSLTTSEQLRQVRHRAAEMMKQQDAIYAQLQEPLRSAGLHNVELCDLHNEYRDEMEQYFDDLIAPALSLLALEGETPTILPSLKLIIAFELEGKGDEGSRLVGIILPDSLPRYIPAPAKTGAHHILLEQLVLEFAHKLMPQERILDKSIFRLTRNGDIILEDEEGDMAREMSEVLIARQFSHCVRLEIPRSISSHFAQRIAQLADIHPLDCYQMDSPLRLADTMQLCMVKGHEEHQASTWKSAYPAGVDPHLSMFENIVQGDILINNPFESYEPVIQLIEEAARDPQVIAIKQVLYRTAKNSRFIAALCHAAEAGKQVTVLVEIKARFDEKNNLEQADTLQRAGVQVVYGVKGYKTHAKVLLIVRREGSSLRRYCHFGTGNYNESTARFYTDLSLLTCNDKLGADASQFFNSVTGLTQLTRFRALPPSPIMMKQRLIELIDAETARAKQGETAQVKAKMNSLNDIEIMAALDRADKAGVDIQLNIRGVCCWVPEGRDGQKNTRIVSIIDRYLEHARILSFHNAGQPLTYIASADWMSRNLNSRVELMIPIVDPDIAHRVRGILDSCLRDNVQAFELGTSGDYTPLEPEEGQSAYRMQKQLQEDAEQRALINDRKRSQTLEPHLPTGTR